MPFVFIRDTQTRPDLRVRQMLDATHQAICHVLELPDASVWVRYEQGNPAYYWQGKGGDVSLQELPVFVTVCMLEGRDSIQIQILFREVSDALARTLSMDPNRVWIRMDELKPDRVALGANSYAAMRGSS